MAIWYNHKTINDYIQKKIGNYTEPKKTAYVQKKGKSFFKWCEFKEYNKNQ